MGILNTLLRAVTWWNGQTLNTQLWTWRKGIRVGEDDQGNVFYHNADDSRRWVIFNGEAEASRISPEWHGWMQQPHQENLTGTAMAYAPAGSIRRETPKARADYEAWSPE
jgi:NADH:ubiquinone oxidoreductase subunit